MTTPTLYPLGDYVPHWPAVTQRDMRAVRTSDYREPKAGEWYLSGAIPTAYLAPNDLCTAYYICRLVRVESVLVVVEVL